MAITEEIALKIRKGDSIDLEFEVTEDDVVYITNPNDTFVFTVKSDVNSTEELIKKTFIGNNTSRIIFSLVGDDTKKEVGKYKYDVFWVNRDYTPIVDSLQITEVVHNDGSN